MNEDNFEGKWDQLKGTVKETWGELSDDELAKTEGKKDKLIGLIQQTYGETKEVIEEKINDLLENLKQ